MASQYPPPKKMVVVFPPIFPPKKVPILLSLYKNHGISQLMVWRSKRTLQKRESNPSSWRVQWFLGKLLLIDFPPLATLGFPGDFCWTPGDAMLHQLSTSKQPKQVDDSKAPRAVDDTAASWMSFVKHVAWKFVGHFRRCVFFYISKWIVFWSWWSRWWLQTCFFFQPYLAKWSNLTSIFFKWVQTTNQW